MQDIIRFCLTKSERHFPLSQGPPLPHGSVPAAPRRNRKRQERAGKRAGSLRRDRLSNPDPRRLSAKRGRSWKTQRRSVPHCLTDCQTMGTLLSLPEKTLNLIHIPFKRTVIRKIDLMLCFLKTNQPSVFNPPDKLLLFRQ